MIEQHPPIGGTKERNAFDALRVTAASAVLFSHAFVLYGLPQPNAFGAHTLGTVAVYVFFAISGYLIAQSWDRDPHFGRYVGRRALRIVPGLVVVGVFSALVLGPLVTSHRVGDYLANPQTWRYVVLNASVFFGEFRLPGVFESNPQPYSVNGSLWTLRYEVLMYLVLALMGVVSLRLLRGGRRNVFTVLFLLMIGAAVALKCLDIPGWRVPIPPLGPLVIEFDGVLVLNLGIYFFAGVLLYEFRSAIPLKPSLAWLGVVLMAVSGFAGQTELQHMASWLVIPYAALVAAWHLPRAIRNWNGHDYSYGIYIYAFPIQQALSLVGLRNGWSFLAVLLMELLLTVLCAALSWHLVEKQALRFKSRLGSAQKVGLPATAVQLSAHQQ